MTFQSWPSWAAAEAGLAADLPAPDISTLGQAYQVAERRLAGRTRPDGSAYLGHLLEVVEILVRVAGAVEPETLAAGLLHDLVAQSGCTPDGALSVAFGGRVALADRYSQVQRLHTLPGVAGQRVAYAATLAELPGLLTRWPEFAELYRDWAATFAYLAADAVDTLPDADLLAGAVHQGQVDKSGVPYVRHVRAVAALVAERGGTEHQQMAGLLHDCVEDTATTLADLTDLGVPAPVVTLVDALTRRPGERHTEYVLRVAAVPEAVLIKRADIAHNTSPARVAELDDATRARLADKYAHALELLDQASPSR